jgi:hypothetical protein
MMRQGVRWGLDWLKKEGKRGGREKGGHGGDSIRFHGDRWRGAEGGGGVGPGLHHAMRTWGEAWGGPTQPVDGARPAGTGGVEQPCRVADSTVVMEGADRRA